MSKVKLTREQKKALEIYKGYNENLETFIECKDSWSNTYQSLKELTLDEMARLLYQEDSYEIKEEFKVGDWVVNSVGNIGLIDEILSDDITTEYRGKWYTEKGMCIMHCEINNIERHATAKEIEVGKERRWWAKHGRESWELKVGDVLWDIRREEVYIMDRNRDVVDVEARKHHKIICFAEDRKDE